MAETAAGEGGWGKLTLPETEEEGAAEAARTAKEGRSAKEIAREVSRAVGGKIAPAAGKAAEAMRSGVDQAARALSDPAEAGAKEMDALADLPEVEGDDPLLSLGTRLDREADFYRGIALRQLARAAWMDRISVIGAVVAAIGVAVLAAIAGFRALFAPDGAWHVAALLGVGAFLLLVSSLTLGRVASRIRAGQAQSAREAFARADLAELRLHRIGALLALRSVDAAAFGEVLRALEGDIRVAK